MSRISLMQVHVYTFCYMQPVICCFVLISGIMQKLTNLISNLFLYAALFFLPNTTRAVGSQCQVYMEDRKIDSSAIGVLYVIVHAPIVR